MLICGRRYALEIEQRVAERRTQERHLHVDHEDDTVPKRHIARALRPASQAGLPNVRPFMIGRKMGTVSSRIPTQSRNMPSTNRITIIRTRMPYGGSPVPRIDSATNVLAALDDEEADEHRGAEEDPHHHRGRLQCSNGGLVHRQPVQSAVQRGHEQSAERADASGLDRRRDPEEDNAQHEDDQQQRRDRVLEQAYFFLKSDPFFRWQCGAKAGIDVAADRDVARCTCLTAGSRGIPSRPATRPAIAAPPPRRRSPSPTAESECRACRLRASEPQASF